MKFNKLLKKKWRNMDSNYMLWGSTWFEWNHVVWFSQSHRNFFWRCTLTNYWKHFLKSISREFISPVGYFFNRSSSFLCIGLISACLQYDGNLAVLMELLVIEAMGFAMTGVDIFKTLGGIYHILYLAGFSLLRVD